MGSPLKEEFPGSWVIGVVYLGPVRFQSVIVLESEESGAKHRSQLDDASKRVLSCSKQGRNYTVGLSYLSPLL